ncbi:MAG: secretin N-terminal domain-containing protein [Candidatus Omnitrophota bacterium]
MDGPRDEGRGMKDEIGSFVRRPSERSSVVFLFFILCLLSSVFSPLPFAFSSDDVPQSELVDDDERISLDLKGVEVVELFRILSLKTGVTIAPSKSINGRISIFLNNVTFEDALDVVLVSQGFAVEKRDNILFVTTAAEYKSVYGREYVDRREFRSLKLDYAKPTNIFDILSQIKSDVGKVIVDESSGTIILIDIPEKLNLMEKTIKELDQPLDTAVFDLNYADAEELKAQLADILTSGIGDVVADKRSNKIVVSDLASNIKRIRKLVGAVDEEERQVFIEAEIVQVTLDDHFQRGIEWEKIFEDKDGPDITGKFSVASTISDYQKITTGKKLSLGTLSAGDYTAAITFLQTYGDVKVLSRPRIAVVNNQEAKIMVGSREAYVTQSLSQAQTTTVTSESIEFVDVGTKLSVTPTIGKDGFITMKIKPEVSSVRETLTTSGGSLIPIVETSEAETVVKVKDGTMVMIAGLIKNERRDTINGIPLLSRLPFIGGLFGSRDKQIKKTELIVFLTPRLTRGDVSSASSGLEEFMPRDIMPDDIKNAIISNEINKIKARPLDSLPSVVPLAEGKEAVSRQDLANKVVNRMKGLK